MSPRSVDFAAEASELAAEISASGLTPEGLGQRVRTARAWAGISQGQLAEQMGNAVHCQTIKRLESGRPVKGSVVAWSKAVSRATGAPLWFLEHGWDASQ